MLGGGPGLPMLPQCYHKGPQKERGRRSRNVPEAEVRVIGLRGFEDGRGCEVEM